ncbi:MAG: hypothetical protein HZA61_01205 [Candidatus Eisenbacteria bacterium]|uniref:Outer membrane protein beta-barrel domain-containing protein n=1 Tax=Eiseniibacteriota bacterium TaxID=2212470 RepID=A0A933SCT2_UNCEI|nr:hypothetical protein [Candidatus Eisenbacteria bacterium]
MTCAIVIATTCEAAPPFTWEAGARLAGLEGREHDAGYGIAAGISWPFREYATVGLELSSSQFGASAGSEDPLQVGKLPSRQPAQSFAITNRWRFHSAARSGVHVFGDMEGGVAGFSTGEWRWTSQMQSEFESAPRVWGACGGVGFGLRGKWTRPAPGFELAYRRMALFTRGVQSVQSLQLLMLY